MGDLTPIPAPNSRYYAPGLIWHITHRCHKQEFLLKFAKDRARWVGWLYEAKKRYGLCVLNYIVTSNHIHLLVLDTGKNVISDSMQLIAGRTAQEYNKRKTRKGAFWEDRYHATAVDSNEYLLRCMVYVDLNMVRAGVVSHPSQWPDSGYHDIQTPPKRKCILDTHQLMELFDVNHSQSFQQLHRQWIDEALQHDRLRREPCWSESIAVGSEAFVEKTKEQLRSRAYSRECQPVGDKYQLKEPAVNYQVHFAPEKGQLRPENQCYWEDSVLNTDR